MTNFQLLTLIGTIMALMAGQTTIIMLYINAKIDPLRGTLNELNNLVQHFIDLHLNHEGRISTLEERTKKP